MPKRPRVLVVDDDPGIRETMGDILTLEGFSVEVAPDGEQAVALCGKQAFDFALLDIRMPGMDGVELLKNAKEIVPELCVLMMTACHRGNGCGSNEDRGTGLPDKAF